MQASGKHDSWFLSLVAEGILAVDGQGRVWRLKRFSRTGRAIPCPRKRADRAREDGYLEVTSGRSRYILSHRLVWLVTRGSIPVGLEVNHGDGVKSNNAPDNLELLTPKGNTEHAIKVLGKSKSRPGPRPWRAKLSDAARESIRQRTANGVSKQTLADEYGVSRAAIRRYASKVER